MKHARADYDRIQDPAYLIPLNEPVFLIRGQDIVAPDVLDYWAFKALASGSELAMVERVLQHARDMRDWQARFKAKTPDMPA